MFLTYLGELSACVYEFFLILFKFLIMRNHKSIDGYKFRVYDYKKIKPIKTSKIPLPRSGHRIVCDTNNLYSFGGYNPLITEFEDPRGDDEVNVNSYPLFQELWKFNFASKCWKRYSCRQSLPRELASNAVIREGNFLMVYGGTGSPFGQRCSNHLYICQLNNEQGQMLEIDTTGQPPLPQYGQALIYHNDHLYTIGGTTGFTYTCDIHRLNLCRKTWENFYTCRGQINEPKGRYRHEVAFDGQNIYVLGGGTAEDAFDFFEVHTFDIETKQWRSLKTRKDDKALLSSYGIGIPQPRRCHGAVQIEVGDDIHVYIIGGYDGESVFDDLWRLELSTMQWTLINNSIFPKPLYFHSAAVSPEGRMYVFGGIFGGDEIRRSNEIYSVWLCIPKLSEMCWEALLHYNPQIITCPKEKLINIGLPKGFVKRLE